MAKINFLFCKFLSLTICAVIRIYRRIVIHENRNLSYACGLNIESQTFYGGFIM